MSQTTVIFLLLVFILAREVFFLYSTHKLVNKIMSHNFHDYKQSLAVGKPLPTQPLPLAPEEFEEDLGTLQGIGL